MKHLLIDLDGTLYRGDTVIEGAREFIQMLRERKIPFLLLTNCPLNSAAMLQAKLEKMGISVSAGQIMTSGSACGEYIKERYPGKRIDVVGSESLREIIKESGAEVCGGSTGYADAVVVGHTRELAYERLSRAANLIRSGADFIATNSDAVIPDGTNIAPHTGALLSYLEMATGKKPFVVGKPFPYMLQAALKKLNAEKKDCIIIGDGVDTDYAFARKNGIDGRIVLSGVTDYKTAVLRGVPEDKIFCSLADITVL